MITAAISRYIRWVVFSRYYDLWYLQWILKRMRFIRIENNLPKETFRALLQGEIVGIFPEGRRSWDGHLGQAKRGVAALARRTSSPVVPLAVLETFTALPRTRRLPKANPVAVCIGRPLFFSETANKEEDYEKLDRENTQKMMQSIAALLPKPHVA